MVLRLRQSRLRHVGRSTSALTARRMLGVLLVAAIGGLTGGSASADPVVCATLSYRLLGGTRQYVLNNQCYVPSSWSPEETSQQCVLDPALLQVCWRVVLSHPAP